MCGQGDHKSNEDFDRQAIARQDSVPSARLEMQPPHQLDHDARDTGQDQMQPQDAFQFLALKLKLPGQDARRQNRDRRNGSNENVVVGRIGKTAAPHPAGEDVKCDRC